MRELLPERRAGGFSRLDGTVQFYSRVHALCDDAGLAVIVDLGAGRGVSATHPVGLLRRLTDLRKPGRHVIGLDIDPAVLENPGLDEAHVIDDTGRLPLEDASVDLLVSDWTFEHVADPAHLASEVSRILKPGGWVCARTPNKWGLIGVAARTIPNASHARALRRLQPSRKEVDIFPTLYRLNTMAALEEHFPRDQWDHMTYGWDSQISYGGQHPMVLRAASVLSRVTPESLRTVWLIFLQRRPAPPSALGSSSST